MAVHKLARPNFSNFHPPFFVEELGEQGACIWTHVNWKFSCCSSCHVGGGVCKGGSISKKPKIKSLFGGLLHALILRWSDEVVSVLWIDPAVQLVISASLTTATVSSPRSCITKARPDSLTLLGVDPLRTTAILSGGAKFSRG